MKKLLMLGLVLSASLWAAPAKADVDIRIGAGKPAVVIGTKKRLDHYHPPVRQRYYGPPIVQHYHGPPPVFFYPEKVYRHPHKHYGPPHAHRHRHAHPSARHHLRQGQRPLPPPHAYGHWRR